MAEVEEKDVEFDAEVEKVGSARGALRRKLAEGDPKIAEMFSDMTPEQKAWGRLVGKILMAKSNDQVEDAFSWWAQEFNDGIALKNGEKAMAFFHAVASLGIDDAHYRMLRRMYIKANTSE